MNLTSKRWLLLSCFMMLYHVIWAQGFTSTGNLVIGGIVVVMIIILIAVFAIGDGLVAIQTQAAGVNTKGQSLNIIPGMEEITGDKNPDYVDDLNIIKVTKGFDIKLLGHAKPLVTDVAATKVALRPPNFKGLSPIPKLEVEEGTHVRAGDPVFFDKRSPGIKYCSPVSGKFVKLNRGEKRSIVEIIIEADNEIAYKLFDTPDLENSSREEIVTFLIGSGLWPLIKQRPFENVPAIDDVPRDIFISTFDTAPLATDLNVVIEGREKEFQKGLEVLKRLTKGNIYLGLNANAKTPPSHVFLNAQGVIKKWFKGPHPAGNVGTHIHAIKPINKGDVVWTLDVQAVCSFGSMWINRVFDLTRVIALTGDELSDPSYIRTIAGTAVRPLLENKLLNEHVRIVSGDVLSGEQISIDGFLGLLDDQLTVLEEGDQYELFGWLLPLSPRPSISKTFPNFLFPNKQFKANTNTHGEERAFVMTDQYDQVFPMEIYLQHLMKAILVKDIERMEGLGIYELAREDVALPEFVCTSKQALQEILSEGLEYLQEQG